MNLQAGYPPTVTPSSLPSEPPPNFASNRAYHSAMSQHAFAELTQLSKSSRTPSGIPYSNVDKRGEVWRMDSQQTYHFVSVDPSSNHDFVESHSLSNSSGARSTPSYYYDEDAENIDPNFAVEQQIHHPSFYHSRATNILRDSQAYPVASSNTHQLVSEPERVDVAPIAAPVPLPYTARSKEVLSQMISPVQPSGFPRPDIQEVRSISRNSVEYRRPTYIVPVSESTTNFNSNAPYGLHHNYSHEMAQHTITNAYTARKYIRPISPATLIALTEPFLMAWVNEYPMPSPVPTISAIARARRGY
ncbi:hypothetical protein B0H19DRAFT_1365309 [Mycena capillaripes]|nr:hypothetical protein B0H19DRAFT_1365309 [Mycena capillaripes]